VDYFSLDIEGPELEVLETIPWDRVDITVIAVETEFFGEFMEKKLKIKHLLETQGKAVETEFFGEFMEKKLKIKHLLETQGKAVETEFFGEFMEKKLKIKDLLEAQGRAGEKMDQSCKKGPTADNNSFIKEGL
jgi:hypothetical protein